MKGKVYRCGVRSAIPYGGEAWCLKENEKAILRRYGKSHVRSESCRQKDDCRTDGHAKVEGNYRSVSNSERN